VDRNMNEPEFANLMSQILEDMLKGEWEKGKYNNLPKVEEF
jgi:hypothetical protein